MAYIVTKTIKGRQYRYQQRSYREGGRVRTESIYLGPVSALRRMTRKVVGFIDANTTHHRVIDEDSLMRQSVERDARNTQKQAAALQGLHDLYGLKLGAPNPQPVEPVPAQKEAPSPEGAKSE